MPEHQTDAVKKALSVLGGEEQNPRDALELVKQLKKEQRFSLARRILGRARSKKIDDPDLELKLIQQHALCTYKDPDTLRHVALESAWEILHTGVDLEQTDVKETLGIAGAICKRRFDVTNQWRYLEQALHFYERGYKSKHDKRDFGYNGINAAFVHDYLAYLEESTIPGSESAENHHTAARWIRLQLLTDVEEQATEELEQERWNPRTQWWLPATLAEASLGLALDPEEDTDDHFANVRKHLDDATRLEGVSAWEHESTVTQLSRLAWLRISLLPEAKREATYIRVGEAMAPLTGVGADAAYAARLSRSSLHGKVGLALSGGGFRASLFHIGVLARLAELDVLRQVEVLSCVSGGSILGAHYYLELRKRLEEKPDEKLEQSDYIDLVEHVGEQFLAGVQRNIRTRIFRNLVDNFQMIFGRKSRTIRLGELFEKEIYSRVKDGKGDAPRYMKDLRCQPAGWEGDFKPSRDNWRRIYKVPDLILNATTLNTGHNWQFTASWMGEPPEAVGPNVDANERLRRLYYEQAPPDFPDIRLGTAVAASACVPGLFEPVSLHGLFKRRNAAADDGLAVYDVELVDGGVHDNQGVSALLGHDCNIVLVSDASGQMETELKPKDSALPVLLRANSILMKRVRTAEFEDLTSRHRSGQLRGLMFIHLRSDLEPDPEDWADCQDPWEARDDARPPRRRGPVTRYAVLRAVQDRLSAIRTDLDSFSHKEALALMLSGYRMTWKAFKDGVGDLPRSTQDSHRWSFAPLEDLATNPNADARSRNAFLKLLDIARQRAFKIWRMEPVLRRTAMILGVLALLGVLYLAVGDHSFTLMSSRGAALTTVTFLIAVVAGKWAARVFNYESTAWKAAIGIVATIFGTIGARIHLKWFDPWFLERGRVADDSGAPEESSFSDPTRDR